MNSDRDPKDPDRAPEEPLEAEVVEDAANLPPDWQITKPPRVVVTSAWTGKNAVRVARLNTEIAEQDRRAAELELRTQRAEAEAVKLRAETFALLKEVVVRIKRLRQESESLTTQIQIEIETRQDRVEAAKANSARERLLAVTEYQIARYDALVRRTEAKMRAASALQASRQRSETTKQQPDADRQRELAAWAELVAVEAADENLEMSPVSPYGEFAAYHYVCARLRGEKHGEAIASTIRIVANRQLIQPLRDDDEQRGFYRQRYNKRHAVWREHRAALRSAEVAALADEAAQERDLLQKEVAKLKLQVLDRELEIAKLHYGAADAGGDTVYDRET